MGEMIYGTKCDTCGNSVKLLYNCEHCHVLVCPECHFENASSAGCQHAVMRRFVS